MFNQNEVIVYQDKLFRILFLDQENAGLYELRDSKNSPKISYELIGIKELEAKYEQGLIQRADDPYGGLRYDKTDESRLKKADDDYALIEEIAEDPKILYNPSLCSQHLKRLSGGDKSRLRQLYRLIARWFQRGQCKHALLPDYRSVGKNKTYKSNPGRKSGIGTPRPLCDESLKRLMDQVLKKHVLTEHRLSMEKAWVKLRMAYKDSHPQSEQVPSLGQFKSYYYRTYSRRQRNEGRFSSIVYNKDIKAKSGSVFDAAQTAGQVFEIDSTPDNIQLLSAADRSLCVGRPVLYSVTDRYSGMIVGIYVSLESAQYKSAAEALFCAICDKERYFKNTFDIDIAAGWNAGGIPAEVCADNAELEGGRIEVFSRLNKVILHNAAPYRADLKGTVESSLGLLQQEVRRFVKEALQDKEQLKKAGGKDRRTDAVLDIQEYRAIVVEAVKVINARYRRKVPDDFPLNLPRTPQAVWDWAVSTNRTSFHPVHDWLKLRVSLLPQEQASISREGIKCHGIEYWCDKLENDGRFDKDKTGNNPGTPMMAIDNGDVANAWIFPDPKRHPGVFYECSLKSEHKRLRGCSLYEAKEILKNLRKIRQQVIEEQASVRETFERKVAPIIAEAKEKTDAVKDERSKQEKLALLKQSRQNEQNRDSRARSLTGRLDQSADYDDGTDDDDSYDWSIYDDRNGD